jgi:hypothetical protein
MERSMTTGPGVSGHPLPIGTRVHHVGGIYSRSFFLNGLQDLEGHENGGMYWGTIVEVKLDDEDKPRRYPDGSYEYRVETDAPLVADRPDPERWWASYHIDRGPGCLSRPKRRLRIASWSP